MAQDFSRFELAGGYSYGTYDRISATNPLSFSPQGWNGSLATNFKRWVAIEVDAGAQYLNRSVIFGGSPYTLSNSAFYSFHAGPRFSYRGERMTPFAHTLFGIHKTPSYGQATFPTPGTVLVPYENAFGSAFGGGFDFAINRRLALRTQGDYFFTRLSSGSLTALNGYENRFRVVGGIVLNFGSTRRSWARKRAPKRLEEPASAFTSGAQQEQQLPLAVPAYARVESTPAQAPASPSQPATAVPPPKPVATAVPQQTAPQPVSAAGPKQTAPQPVITTPRRPSTQEESLGEAARRYREAKRKKQQQQ